MDEVLRFLSTASLVGWAALLDLVIVVGLLGGPLYAICVITHEIIKWLRGDTK